MSNNLYDIASLNQIIFLLKRTIHLKSKSLHCSIKADTSFLSATCMYLHIDAALEIKEIWLAKPLN